MKSAKILLATLLLALLCVAPFASHSTAKAASVRHETALHYSFSSHPLATGCTPNNYHMVDLEYFADGSSWVELLADGCGWAQVVTQPAMVADITYADMWNAGNNAHITGTTATGVNAAKTIHINVGYTRVYGTARIIWFGGNNTRGTAAGDGYWYCC